MTCRFQSTNEPRFAAPLGAILFAFAVAAAATLYWLIFTNINGAYVKGTSAAIATMSISSVLALANRAFGLRVRPVPALAALMVVFSVFFIAWMMTAGRGALQCWSCTHNRDTDLHFTNGGVAIIAFVLFAVTTAGSTVAISFGVWLARVAFDRLASGADRPSSPSEFPHSP